MLSEGELHVQAMRLVCEALADREKTGLEVDWDVINQQLDHMDVILQGITDQRQDDAEEIEILRKDRDHWMAARKDAIAAGELMQAEIETLRGAMAADDKRLRDAEQRVWPEETWGCDAPDKMADEILSLRQGIERLRAFVQSVRDAQACYEWPASWRQIDAALTELDLKPTSATETEGGK